MHPHGRYLISLSVLGLIFLSSSVDAGPRVKTLDNPIVMRFSSFSTSFALLDDMTNDGIPEYLVGAYDQPYAPEGKTGSEIGVGGGAKSGANADHQGRAFVFDGETAKLLYLIDHPFPQKSAALISIS